ncbi:NHL repeat-containing protein [Paraburkholderia bonniea]|uniref:NHL repeat-containing protein n=1 Tax=Paraburkholderia bonniea TaxID=2152891 RepID=UPI002573BE22|nr:NHL repeat-containing protein [Paraburkholderia bonniea]WJF89159.1 NHL repeat-containing protein [Paraburkholderia bonniea]WJF92475.1 NHL repeat-containing protein [Paraburkholderia bonniea]
MFGLAGNTLSNHYWKFPMSLNYFAVSYGLQANIPLFIRRLAAAMLLFMLAACGGGVSVGDGAQPLSPPSLSSPSPASLPVAQSAPPSPSAPSPALLPASLVVPQSAQLTPALTSLVADGTQSFKVSGTLSGLAEGARVELRNNGTDDLSVRANGSFSFATPVPGPTYTVTVSKQPAWQFCTVTQPDNKASAEVSGVSVSCKAALAQVSTLSGQPGMNGMADGTGSEASFYWPTGVASDANGNLYVTDQFNHVIRKITPAGVTTTLAGQFGVIGSQDATDGRMATFNYPVGIAVDASGNVYVSDLDAHVIRKITPQGAVTTLAGKAGDFGSQDGIGTEAMFYSPMGLALDAHGNVYVADSRNYLIRRISPQGVVTTLAGRAGESGSLDGNRAVATLSRPVFLALDASGNVYVSELANKIRKITPAGEISTFAGSGKRGALNARGTAASFDNPGAIAFDASGSLYVAETGNSLIRKITAAGEVTTLAGAADIHGWTDGVGGQARFANPIGLAIDADGNLYVADQANHLIRKITPVPAP